MALTAAQTQKIAKMWGATPTMVAAQITALGATYTGDIETDVIAEIARWDAGTGTGNVWFTPTESNEGFNMSAPATGGNPAKNIAILLEWPYPVGPLKMGSLAIG